MNVIVLKDITKTYYQNKMSNPILKEINFEVQKGDFISILGKSGTGKSTLLHIIGLMEQPSSGEYWLLGDQINFRQKRKLSILRNTKIGFVLQDYGLITQFNVFDNIATPMYINTSSKKEILKKVTSVAELLHISHLLNNSVASLSGGEKQRVAIARAIIMSPDLILADEPTGSLDYDEKMNILNIFKEMNALGTTVIMVTHDKEVASVCNTCYHLKNGTLNPD